MASLVEATVGLSTLVLVILVLGPLSQAARPGPAGSARVVTVLTGLATAAGGLAIRSPLLALVVPAAGLMVGRRLHRRRLGALARRQVEEVPRVLDAVIQRLGSGSSLGSALAESLAESPTLAAIPEVSEALVGLRAGEPIEGELAEVARRLGTDWARWLDSTIGILVVTGGSQIPAVERLADTLRDQQHARSEADSQSAQAQASAVVLAGLPLGFAAVVAAANPDARGLYLYSWVGAACVAISLGLTSACWWVFDRVLGPR